MGLLLSIYMSSETYLQKSGPAINEERVGALVEIDDPTTQLACFSIARISTTFLFYI